MGFSLETGFSLEDWAGPRRAAVDAFLASRFADAWPPRFAEACGYPLRTGGKRFRPLLVWGACEAVGGLDPVAVAASAELIHTYSLVHDDLPAMDDDAERRGMPTVHVAYGEGPAILVGDALLTEAFAVLAEAPLPPEIGLTLVAELARGAGHIGMIGGQAADIGLGGAVQTLETVLAVHTGKTGALIRASVRMGARAGRADPGQLTALTRYGEAVGLAFQMADDVLDADQDAGADGPPSYVRLLGIDETRRRAQVLLEDALDALRGLPDPEPLAALARYALARNH